MTSSQEEQSVILVLDGPLQSWGTDSRFGQRYTDSEPSKSGVLGVIGAALGMPRDDTTTLGRLAELTMAIRVDRPGTLLRDYHTAGGGTFRGRPHSVHGAGTVLSTRYYLADACFVVAFSGNDTDLVRDMGRALQNPRWPLFLGRRSCTPARPIFLGGPVAGSARELLEKIPWQGSFPGIDSVPPERIKCVVEAESGRTRSDVPLSFDSYSRSFKTRVVADEWIDASSLPTLEGESDVSHSTLA